MGEWEAGEEQWPRHACYPSVYYSGGRGSRWGEEPWRECLLCMWPVYTLAVCAVLIPGGGACNKLIIGEERYHVYTKLCSLVLPILSRP